MGALAHVDIRPARDDERKAVAALYWRTWHETQASLEPPEIVETRPLGFFDKRVASWPTAPLVAWSGGQLLGFAAWQEDYLGQMFVHPATRSTGLGAHLLAAAEEAMATSGIRNATLDCIVGNDRAKRFYERHGWQVEREMDDPHPVAGQSRPLRIWRMVKRLEAP